MHKIIHLSDLHIGYPRCTGRARKIFDRLIAEMNPPQAFVIIICGDLVESGFEEPHLIEASRQIRRLKRAGFHVLCVPGNHDCGNGILGAKELSEAFRRRFLGPSMPRFPKLDIIDDCAFIGLDSMAEELNWHDSLFADGELGAEQLSRLESLLISERVRDCRQRVVYLHHHPFDQLFLNELKDAEALKKVIANRVDALLFGHNHVGGQHNGKWGIARCYDGGSATGKDGAPSEIRLIRLSSPPEEDILLDFGS